MIVCRILLMFMVFVTSACQTYDSGAIPTSGRFETVSITTARSLLIEAREIGGGTYLGSDSKWHYLVIATKRPGRSFQDSETGRWQMQPPTVIDRFARVPASGFIPHLPFSFENQDAQIQPFSDWRTVFTESDRQ